MKALIRLGAVLFVGFILLAQAPTNLSRLWLSYKLAGDGATAPFRTSWVYVDDSTMEVVMIGGYAQLRIKPEFTCRPQQDYYVGTQQASYPLKPNVNPNVPVVAYVNGLLISPDKLTVSANKTSVALTGQFTSPEIVIRYCTM